MFALRTTAAKIPSSRVFTKFREVSQIVVVGASVIDCVAHVDRMPKIGETLIANNFGTYFGGKGANQAVMAAKLGSDVSVVTKINPEDQFGQYMTKHFKSIGLNIEHVLTCTDAPTGAASIAVDLNGKNCIAVCMGANSLITEQDTEDARQTIQNAKVLICQLETPHAASLHAMKIAKEAGTTTLLNTAPITSEIDPQFLELADIICPNEVETEFMTGHKVDTLSDAFKASISLREKASCETVILTLGSRGVVVADQDHDPVHVGVEKVDAVDTVGAGDAFVGAFAHFRCCGLSVIESCERACAVASISVTKHGAQSSYPVFDELPESLKHI